MIVIHGLRECLDLPYRRLLDVLHEMHGIVAKMGLDSSELPDFTTVCVRKQQLTMVVWRTLLRLSADLHETETYRLSTQLASTVTPPVATTQTGLATPSDR
jgi:IS5 family transposase